MTPIRVETLGVEPVSLAEMRAYLRLDPDDTAEDALLASLIAAARASVEAACRRILVAARFRLTLTAWPGDGIVPVPLSPLVSVGRAETVGADGMGEAIDPSRLRVGPDPWEAPCLIVDAGVPLLLRRAALIEVIAGCGGEGPPAPEPLAQAIRMLAAEWFEHRGDAEPGGLRGMSPQVAALVAPCRLMRI